MSLCPSKQRRMVCRLWTLVGFVWISCGWVVWFKKDFTESPQDWMIVALVRETIPISLVLLGYEGAHGAVITSY